MSKALLAAVTGGMIIALDFLGSAYAATAACNFPAEPSEKTSDTKTYNIPCQLGTGAPPY
jgi:hypothetical protein